jgi:hypothetical protein
LWRFLRYSISIKTFGQSVWRLQSYCTTFGVHFGCHTSNRQLWSGSKSGFIAGLFPWFVRKGSSLAYTFGIVVSTKTSIIAKRIRELIDLCICECLTCFLCVSGWLTACYKSIIIWSAVIITSAVSLLIEWVIPSIIITIIIAIPSIFFL